MKADETHLLVQSLSKAEKRYFQLHAAREAGDKKYLQLFRLLEARAEYDEEVLLKKMSGMSAKQLHTQLQYLQEQILSSLHLQYRSDYTSRISGQLHRAQLMRNKGMYNSCIRLLEKVLQEAASADDHLHSCQALDQLLNTLRNDVDPPVSLLQLTNLFDRQQQHLQSLQTEMQLERMHTEVVHPFRKKIRARSTEEQKRYEEIFQHPALATPLSKLSPRSRIHCCNILYIQGMYTEDLQQCLQNTTAIIEVFQQNPLLIEAMPHRYRSALYNHAKTLFYINRNKQGLQVMQEIRQLPERYPRIFGESLQRMRIFELVTIATLTHFFKGGLIKEGMKYLEELNPELKTSAPYLNRVNHLYILSFMQALNFAGGKWEEALDANLQILHAFKEEEAPRIYFISRIVQLICHYELKNFSLLDSLTRSAYRYFVQRPNPFRFEKVVIGFIKKAGSLPDREKIDVLLMELNDQLNELQADPLENAVHDFYYLQWLQSRITRKHILQFTQGKTISK